MITKAQAIKLVNRYIKEELHDKPWYKHIEPHIKAVLLYGSISKGTNHEQSDIDILIIVPLAVEERYTAGEYNYEYRGQNINIVLRSIEKLRHIAQEHNDQFQKEVFRGCEILTASDGEVQGLLDRIADI